MKVGSYYIDQEKCEFTVWAPFLKSVELKIVLPQEQIIPMEKDARGYWSTVVDDISHELQYFYRLGNKHDRPDPASHFQPQGVHGPSKIINHRTFHWGDSGWKGIRLSDLIIYEIHIGTFTEEGTFDAIIPRLNEIRDAGINAIEIMPVAQFPGERNWGYDGVFLYAVQNSYGGPEGLKRLVNDCHKNNIAVILDVVYNHLGPEGNYLWDYGPYFTDKYKTPWGMAINFDDAYSNEVRNFFLENALHWLKNYHIDALRLDAIHGISDLSAKPFLRELSDVVKNFATRKGKKGYLIAESDLNDIRVIKSRKRGGFGIHAQWSDDFHHSLHTLLTGENEGYYVDFGKSEHLVKALREGFVYSGEYSEYRKRNHGNSSKDVHADQLIVCAQNHDQVGNRMFGDRLSSLVSFESLKLTAGIVLLSPYIPLLFMGEEYGEEAPFLYFVNHSDQSLIKAVRRGRKEEFKTFNWEGDLPDPQSFETFQKSKLQWHKRKTGKHKVLLHFNTHLIQLRRETPALSTPDKKNLDICVLGHDRIFLMRRWKGNDHVFCCFNFNKKEKTFELYLPQGTWSKVVDSSDKRWKGLGTHVPDRIKGNTSVTLRGRSFIMYTRKLHR